MTTRLHRLRLVLVAPLLAIACGDDGDDTGGDTQASESSSSGGPTTTATTMSTTISGSESGTTDAMTSGPIEGTSGSEGRSGPDPDGSSSDSGSSGTAACEGMTFFASSVGSGRSGGNLGGIAGADATCQALADAAGQGGCTWQAYLSSADEDARDRIGAGPWFNAAGDMLAADVDALHAEGFEPNDIAGLIVDENGAAIPGGEHDILTGSEADGTVLDGATCDDWTSASGGAARVGHSDIPANPQFSRSWNSAHDAPGCDPESLAMVGGAGRLYCFAID
jgi:hypothetical protein